MGETYYLFIYNEHLYTIYTIYLISWIKFLVNSLQKHYQFKNEYGVHPKIWVWLQSSYF